MDWQEIRNNWVLTPKRPVGIIHFLGGAFVAAIPHVTYRLFLEELYQQHYAVIATPFVNTLDHYGIADTVLVNFERALERLRDQGVLPYYLPIYGIGHSMGCKLHLLINSYHPVERAGNVFISYNNYPVRRSIPFIEQLSGLIEPTFLKDVEFTPSPEEMTTIVAQQYPVRRNLLIRFSNDEIDQTQTLSHVLLSRFPQMVTNQRLQGNHLTPLGQNLTWKVGNAYSPLDALGQWLNQEIYRDFNQMKQVILHWLNPIAALRRSR
ncbi:DUF1350 family protein [Trichothermofontia sp.]